MNETASTFYKDYLNIIGEPQTYKTIKLYPIKIKDVKYINIFYRIFQQPKNSLPIKDSKVKKQILKMSFLKFYLYALENNTKIAEDLLDFLSYITHNDRRSISYSWDTHEEIEGDVLDKLEMMIKINSDIFTETDFDAMRDIILESNGTSPEYIEEYNQELEEKLISINELGATDIEEEILVFCSLMGKLLYEVQEHYTLYQFQKHFERKILLLNYEMLSPLEISGQIKAKDGRKITKHYLTHLVKQGRYSSILIPKEEFMSRNADLLDGSGKN